MRDEGLTRKIPGEILRGWMALCGTPTNSPGLWIVMECRLCSRGGHKNENEKLRSIECQILLAFSLHNGMSAMK
jgi:hypothetical protein